MNAVLEERRGVTADELSLLTGYANDAHPRVSEDEMQRAIEETENFHGCDFAEFTPAMEDEAVARAVERRVALEEDWFDGSENIP